MENLQALDPIYFAKNRAIELYNISKHPYENNEKSNYKINNRQKLHERRRTNAHNTYKRKFQIKNNNKPSIKQKVLQDKNIIQTKDTNMDKFNDTDKHKDNDSGKDRDRDIVNDNVFKCRRYRRRRAEFLHNHCKGKKNKSYEILPTHLWHRKRMKMENIWGIMLPTIRCDKSLSFFIKAVKKNCVIHDASYYKVLELKGTAENIIKIMQLLNKNDEMSSFLDLECLSGKKQGKTILYVPETSSSPAFGTASFMWDPQNINQSESMNNYNFLNDNMMIKERSLWLWIHPNIYNISYTSVKRAMEIFKERDNKFTINIVERWGEVCRFDIFGKTAYKTIEHLHLQPKLGTSVRYSSEKTLETSIYEASKDAIIKLDSVIPGRKVINKTHCTTKRINHFAKLDDNECLKIDEKKHVDANIFSMAYQDIVEARESGADHKEHVTPILIVKRKEENLDGYSLVVQGNYGTHFLSSLIHCGASAIGLKHMAHLVSGPE